MTIGSKQHPADTFVQWAAPIVLGAACAWAAWALTLSPFTGAAAAASAVAAGIVAMKLFGNAPAQPAGPLFELFEFEECVDADEELLLNDPLSEIVQDSRVVQLFAKVERTPGELVARIEDYLGDGRHVEPGESEVEAEEGYRSPDASAALHAALANIRASLR